MRKKKKKARRHLGSWLTIGISVLVMLAPIVGLAYFEVTTVKTDKQGCPAGKPRRLLLAIIDQSDPFDEVDREKVISALVKEQLQRLGQYDRAVVMTLNTDKPASLRILFQKCAPKNPAHGETLSDQLFLPPQAVQTAWVSFENQSDLAIRATLQGGEQPTTPLLETLIAVAKDPALRSTEERTFLVFSDMIQNSRWLNFYKQVPNAAKIKELGIPVESDFFSGTSIYIHHITRYDPTKKRPVQSQKFRSRVRAFWETWLDSQGAKTFWPEHAGEVLQRPR